MGGVAIIGAGQGGLQVAVSLRQSGYNGPITLFGDEPVPPYQRPPLSKTYLMDKRDRGSLLLRAPAFFEKNNIRLRVGQKVVEIDRAAKSLVCVDGSVHPYDYLVLATGSRNRRLTVPGADLHGIFSLRTLADADRMRPMVQNASRTVVIGGGLIGLEIAALMCSLGRDVTILEAGSRLAARTSSPALSARLLEWHRQDGIDIRLNSVASAFRGTGGSLRAIETGDGSVISADLAIISVGAEAETSLAEAAGLMVSNGVVVDMHMVSSDSSILAIGDCARVPLPDGSGGTARLESVAGAVEQGKCAAAFILGRPTRYAAVPWTWSDQGSIKLQIAGWGITQDDEVQIDSSGSSQREGTFKAVRDGKLVAVECVNQPAVFTELRSALSVQAKQELV